MKKALNLFVCSIIFASCFEFAGCTRQDALSLNNKEKIKKITLKNETDNAVEIPLYFDASSNDKKAEISNETRVIQKEEVLGEIIMQELIKGPAVTSNNKPILPKNTRLISFSINDSIAYVNLSQEAVISMSPVKEEACLKSIVYSLCQLDSVKKVMIQIDNKNVDTLGGNFNISKPLGKDDIENARKK